MARIEKMTISYRRVLQVQQFEPIEFLSTVEVSLDEGDNYREIRDKIENELATDINNKAKVIQEYAKQNDPRFMK